jgi:hypothetical protein
MLLYVFYCVYHYKQPYSLPQVFKVMGGAIAVTVAAAAGELGL